MSHVRHLLTVSAFAVVLFAPAVSPAQGIKVHDFATGTGDAFYELSGSPELRRQHTSTVRIIKDLIDLVPFDQVKATGASLSAISNGRTTGSGGRQVGYIEMNVNVPSSASAGGTVQIAVGFSDKFTFKVVRKGLIENVTFNPVPSTVQVGAPIVMTATGVDFGTPNVVRLACHTVTNVSRGGTQANATFTATLTRSSSCSTNPSTYLFGIESTASSDPNTYTQSNADGTWDFHYAAAPPTGVTCVSNPSIGAPAMTAPVNGSTISFAAASTSPTGITVRWSLADRSGQQGAPLNEYLLTVRHSGGRTLEARTVTGLSAVVTVPIGATVTIDLRAKNCGEPSPTSSLTFTTKYQ
ncbi:MAG: hypothetical protein IPP90_04140 [Gemmatimonadaceae bacterium]|nr:hypothetical protein [Gemmatimonadaceae bacterium]